MPESASLLERFDELATSITVVAKAANVAVASAWLARMGDMQGIPPRPLMRLDQCLDEVLANIIDHGGIGAHETPVSLDLQVSCHDGEYRATLTVCDGGIEFNPLTAAPPPRALSLDEAEPGGLGLLMLRRNSDKLSYSYCQGRNLLSIEVVWQVPLERAEK